MIFTGLPFGAPHATLWVAMDRYKPVVLCILDGFGIAPPGEGNAVSQASMPYFRQLLDRYPAMTVQASGAAVGLSWGEMGNSEVGHLTIGAGRVFYQHLPRINLAIETGAFFENVVLRKAIERGKNGHTVHLMGLVSAGGVHALQDHVHALLDLCAREGCKHVMIHAFLDGRDTAYNSAKGFLRELEQKISEVKIGRIATISGRYYAMDRDNHWERIEQAYQAIALGKGETASSAIEAVEAAYAQGIFDEQIVPTVIRAKGQPSSAIASGDAVIFFNFRSDRARELTRAFTLPAFDKFSRSYIPDLFFVTFTEYEKGVPTEVAFPTPLIEHGLAQTISEAGMRQLHIAETEKYAHVTFFLNGMREDPFPGEDRVIIPSPRVSSYDQEPAMSAPLIAERVVKEIAAGSYDFIVVNFANADMVGHTGNVRATVEACEVLDRALALIGDEVLAVGGALVITADHGNAEEVTNILTGEMDKEHSNNPVPFVVVSKDVEGMKAPSGDVVGGDLSLTTSVGMLADTAPTICKLLGIPPAPDMTGQPLI